MQNGHSRKLNYLAVNPSIFSQLEGMPSGAGIGLFIAFIGLVVTGLLYAKKVPGAILIGILATMTATHKRYIL